MLRTNLVYLFIGTYVLLLAPFGLVWTALVKDAHILFCLVRFCICGAGWIAGVRVNVEGIEKIDPARTCVFLSNHQGNFDGPVLLHVLGRDLRALVKKEMMRLPILSLILRATEFVPLERANPQQARAGIERSVQLIKQGKSFFAFPEGTRSRDGSLGKFKKGCFIMAIQAEVPIVPVTIANSAAIQPPGSYSIRPGRIRVIIHDPIETRGMAFEDRNALIQKTRAAIASGF
jgi:1-acyl-sn-glycerol-3-phosphate acyltransferase